MLIYLHVIHRALPYLLLYHVDVQAQVVIPAVLLQPPRLALSLRLPPPLLANSYEAAILHRLLCDPQPPHSPHHRPFEGFALVARNGLLFLDFGVFGDRAASLPESVHFESSSRLGLRGSFDAVARMRRGLIVLDFLGDAEQAVVLKSHEVEGVLVPGLRDL